jgi:hypothetical protein
MAPVRLLTPLLLLLLFVGVPAATAESVGVLRGRAGASFVPETLGLGRGGCSRGLRRPQLDAEAGETLLETSLQGRKGAPGVAALRAVRSQPVAVPACPGLSPAAGWDVTKPVSTLLLPHPRPLAVILGPAPSAESPAYSSGRRMQAAPKSEMAR